MHLGHTLTALLGFGSLVAAAPTAVEHKGGPVSGAPRHKRSIVSSSPFIKNETQIGSINVGKIGAIGQLEQISQFTQLIQIAEAQLLAQVQSQILLAAQLQTIKNNIRINTFKARFPQVNTVVVTVTNVIDARDPLNVNRRYLLDHLVVDNGFADKEQVVMVTEAQAMTITADATAAATSTSAASTTEAADVTSTLDIAALLSSALVARATETATADASARATVTPASTFPVPLSAGGIATQIISQQSNIVSAFNPADPFSFLNQSGSGSLLLPYDTAAPLSQLILEDPANIIFAGNHNLLVQSIGTFQADCLAFGLGGNAFLGGAAGLNLFGSVQQAIVAQLTTIQIGTRVQGIPPAVLLGHPDLAAGLKSFRFSKDGKAALETAAETATETAKETKEAKATESATA